MAQGRETTIVAFGKTIASLRPIRAMSQSPTKLVLYADRIWDWSGLDDLANLETLEVSGSIPPASTLVNLSKLRSFKISGISNKIDLTALSTMKQQLAIEISGDRQNFVLPKAPNITVKYVCSGLDCPDDL
jgi:hypothetical protein